MKPHCYVFAFDDRVGTREELKRFLDSRGEILNWLVCMNNCFFVASEESAVRLQEIVREYTRGVGRFIILKADDRSIEEMNGSLPIDGWDFLYQRDTTSFSALTTAGAVEPVSLSTSERAGG